MKFALGAIVRHETCRWLGHRWKPYRQVHHEQLDTSFFRILVTESGKTCQRCGMKRDVDVAVKP